MEDSEHSRDLSRVRAGELEQPQSWQMDELEQMLDWRLPAVPDTVSVLGREEG